MGVHGLTTYLRENKRVLSKTYEFPLNDPRKHTPIVVDGWSFIYELNNTAGLPWVYGGEYQKLAEVVEKVTRAWIQVGFDVHVVFDGPQPEIKFPTQIVRLTQSHIQPSLLFFRTSPTSRTSPRFLHETRIIPPLSYLACLEALQSISSTTEYLHLHFADEECDPYAVCLAGRLNTYIIGNDSDYAVFNVEGYRGLIPLSEMAWHVNTPQEGQQAEEGDDWQMQSARKTKSKRTNPQSSSGRGIIPPEAESLALTLTAYSPTLLATHLKLPVTLLPLVGALVGNDFSLEAETQRRHIQSFFFEKRMASSQRIAHVAATIAGILSPSSKRKRSKHAVGSVMDLIDRTVNDLLIGPATTMSSGEVDKVVEKVVQATLQYAIPKVNEESLDQYDGHLWIDETCAVHKANALCPLTHFVSRRAVLPTEEGDRDVVGLKFRQMFLQAYRSGSLYPKLMQLLHSGTYWQRLFLENPDYETTGRSIVRPIREWVYSILHDAVGLPELPPEEEDPAASSKRSGVGDSTEGEEEDEDELIDVVEVDSEEEDPLAPLKGALKELHGSDEESVPESTAPSTPAAAPPASVKEYIRRGGRIAEEIISVQPLSELLATLLVSESLSESQEALLLQPEDVRITVFLQILDADFGSIRSLPMNYIIPVVAIRWVVKTMHSRAQDSGSKEREGERWTKREACCFLSVFTNSTKDTELDTDSPLEITNRNVQLVAQILTTLEHVHYLSQTLFLSEQLSSGLGRMFSGKLTHALLTGAVPLGSLDSNIVEAIGVGLEGVYAEERKKGKKAKKTNQAVSVPSRPGKQQPNGRSRGGLYDLLLDADA